MVHSSTASLAAVIAAFGALIAYQYYRKREEAPQGHNSQPLKKGASSKSTESLEDSESLKDILGDNVKLLSAKDRSLVRKLIAAGQQAVFENWTEAGVKDEEKKEFLTQLEHLDANYAGGLPKYLQNTKRLLRDAQDGKNPFDGFAPSVPQGIKLDYASREFQDFESKGVAASKHAAFVLVAGGLGERLGYSDIKVKLPVDSVRGASFLQEYIEAILALQSKNGKNVKLQFAIMTSGDTHDKTAAFLKENNHFGAHPSQITLMKQEKVACLKDTAANLALNPSNQYELQTKPHGHGDVHALLHSTGLAKRWAKSGVKWVCFFQDTNGLVFRGLVPALGVSEENDYDMNSLAVPRKAQEAIGGITCLTHRDGRRITINVEYNQLDPLLRATNHPDGDTNDSSGYSPFPGNINQLILKMDTYSRVLEETKGIVAEFVNPKYADSSKTAFKSATRLECMMQDYPLALPSTANVGFTVINQVWAAYSPVKNNPEDAKAKAEGGNPSHSATSGELDVYQVNCRALKELGANVQGPEKRTFNGLEVEVWPRVTWSPSFAISFADIQDKIDGKNLTVSAKSSLLVKGEHLKIEGLDLDGALVVDLASSAELKIKNATVKNKGWSLQPIKEGPGKRPATEEEQIRGFLVCRREAEELKFAGGSQVFPVSSKSKAKLESETSNNTEPQLATA